MGSQRLVMLNSYEYIVVKHAYSITYLIMMVDITG